MRLIKYFIGLCHCGEVAVLVFLANSTSGSDGHYDFSLSIYISLVFYPTLTNALFIFVTYFTFYDYSNVYYIYGVDYWVMATGDPLLQ